MNTITLAGIFKNYLCDDNFNFESNLYNEVMDKLVNWGLTRLEVVTLAALIRIVRSNYDLGNYYWQTINVAELAEKMCKFTGKKHRALTDEARDKIVLTVKYVDKIRLEYTCKPAGKKLRWYIKYDRFIDIKEANLDEKSRIISLEIVVGEGLRRMISPLT